MELPWWEELGSIFLKTVVSRLGFWRLGEDEDCRAPYKNRKSFSSSDPFKGEKEGRFSYPVLQGFTRKRSLLPKKLQREKS